MVDRWIRGSVALHDEFRFLVAQHLLSGHQVPIAKSHRRIRRASELRLQTTALGFARRKLLVWRENQHQRHTKSAHPGFELTHRWHYRYPHHQAPVTEIQLQRWHLYPVWWQLSERFGGVAVLLAGKAQLADRVGFRVCATRILFSMHSSVPRRERLAVTETVRSSRAPHARITFVMTA